MSSIRDIYDAANALPLGERQAWLMRHCPDESMRARVAAMLDISAQSATGEPSLEALLEALSDDEPLIALPGGGRIGPFELTGVLGHGGFSTVYRGRRELEGAVQEVAVKLLHHSLHAPDAQRRFRREQRVLAQLQHPNIARLIEGGVTGAGLPYIALELVEGERIDLYACRHQLGLRARLELFLVVCAAVEAAHRALIVHRDLKPANVLVTGEGHVKLLDFGIAKLLEDVDGDDVTRTGHQAFTPAYAAPEQRAGAPVSTATDVYALGVLLGELLSGQRLGADTGSDPDACISGDEPPGTLPESAPVMRRHLRGDLGAILRKALAAEPEQRYATASGLADDVQRVLQGHPVSARRATRWYRTQRFVQRHRGGVAMALAFVLALSAALAAALWQADVARAEARRADAQAQQARIVRDLLLGMFEGARASLPRDLRPQPEQLLDQARRQLDRETELAPEARIELERAFADVSLSLSALSESERALAEAESLARLYGLPAQLDAIRIARADVWQRQGRDQEALQLLAPLVPELRQRDDPLLGRTLAVMAAAYRVTGEPQQTLELMREAVELATRRYGHGSIEALAAGLDWGTALAAMQRYREAEEALVSRLDQWRQQGSPTDDRYLRGLSSLGVARHGLGKLDDAERHFRELLQARREIYPEQHPVIATSLRNLANLLGRGGEPERARELLEEALEIQRSAFGGQHREIALTYADLGVLASRQRRFDEAGQYFHAALEQCEVLALRDDVCARTRNNLGQSLYRQGRLDEAELHMREALAERRALFGDVHPTVAYSLATLGNVATARNDGPSAIDYSQEALHILEVLGQAEGEDAATIRQGLAMALRKSGEVETALVEIERAIKDWRRLAPGGHQLLLSMLIEYAQIARAMRDEASVRRILQEIQALEVPEDQLTESQRAILANLALPSDA